MHSAEASLGAYRRDYEESQEVSTSYAGSISVT
jgi:hypothetical protein